MLAEVLHNHIWHLYVFASTVMSHSRVSELLTPELVAEAQKTSPILKDLSRYSPKVTNQTALEKTMGALSTTLQISDPFLGALMTTIQEYLGSSAGK